MSNLAYSVVIYKLNEILRSSSRQLRHHDAKADIEQKHQKREATRDAYRAANQLRMAARRYQMCSYWNADECVTMVCSKNDKFGYNDSSIEMLTSLVTIISVLKH